MGEGFNWDAGKFWLSLLQALATLGLWLWVRMTMGQKTNAQELDSLRERVAGIEEKQLKLEATVKTLPTTDKLHRLELEITELSGELKAITPKLEQVSKLANMLLENEFKG